MRWVDCWASWCGSFQQINLVIEDAAIEFAGQIKVGRLNIVKAEVLAARYGIRAVLTLLLFSNGQVLEQVIGGVSSLALTNKLNALLLVSNSSKSRIGCL
ncbi:MAG: thioredoxin [Verrucomicrobia bacterium]|nr:thioredoxin [Leptolyngbya sp. ES-bin-22]